MDVAAANLCPICSSSLVPTASFCHYCGLSCKYIRTCSEFASCILPKASEDAKGVSLSIGHMMALRGSAKSCVQGWFEDTCANMMCCGIDRDCGCSDPCCIGEWGGGMRPTGFVRGRRAAAQNISNCLFSGGRGSAAASSNQLLNDIYQTSKALIEEQRFDECINVLIKGLKSFPKSFELNYLSGICHFRYSGLYYQANRFGEAHKQLQKAEKLFSKASKIKKDDSYSYFYLGAIAERKNDKAKAVRYYKRSLKLNPGNINALNRLRALS